MAGEELGKGSLHSLLVRLQTGPATLQISVENPKKAKNKFTI